VVFTRIPFQFTTRLLEFSSMLRTWKVLSYLDDHDLRSRSRLRRLWLARNVGTWAASLGSGMGAIALAGTVMLLVIALPRSSVQELAILIASSLLTLGMSVLFGWAARVFALEAQQDPLGRYLKEPRDFKIFRGEIRKATYVAGSKRSLDRMNLRGMARSPEGVAFDFEETVAARIWYFRDNEKRLKPGDDWYSAKGKRVALPVAVQVLCDLHAQREPKAVLVGIHQDLIDAAKAFTH
jgi:hypothetical protein